MSSNILSMIPIAQNGMQTIASLQNHPRSSSEKTCSSFPLLELHTLDMLLVGFGTRDEGFEVLCLTSQIIN